MFKPELEVPNIEYCKKLKNLGFPQDRGGWYWILPENKNEWMLCYCIKYDKSEDGIWSFWCYDLDGKPGYIHIWKSQERTIKAPTIRELLKILPPFIDKKDKKGKEKRYWLYMTTNGKVWFAEYLTDMFGSESLHGEKQIWGITLVDALAELVLWLIVYDYLSFENKKEG